jgi:beta-galactosidase/beta-glucuronidase
MENIRPEYPRPELVRNDWLNLNGEWDFEFDFGCNGVNTDGVDLWAQKEDCAKDMLDKGFSKKICVPFCPESKLSGIEYTDFFDACWYKREIEIPKTWTGRVILHFEASFYNTVVFVGTKCVGAHSGGYTPFSFDITDEIVDNKAVILVHASGDARNKLQPSGKQSAIRKSFGCFYTRTTGIWQTVWLEHVPNNYLTAVKIDTEIDTGEVFLKLDYNKNGEKVVKLTALYDNKVVAEKTLKTNSNVLKTAIKIENPKLWNVGDPNLYDLIIETTADNQVDSVKTYFGIRKIDYSGSVILINNKPVFQRLVLDQGYYIDGVYTAPTKEDLEKDIRLSMDVGFNGARLHEKVFERRFLYYADKMGYLCYGEYPSWGFDYTKEENSNLYIREWLESVKRDYNHPCIIGWIPMNENWDIKGIHQSNSLVKAVYEATKTYDETRPVVDVSWNYHVVTDIFDTHDYMQDLTEFSKKFAHFEDGQGYDQYNQKYDGQPYFLSEYGGIGWACGQEGWGYGDRPKTEEEFVDRYIGMSDILHGNEKISAICYTQLYDVEQEQNGIYNYDRTPKFNSEIMAKLKNAMAKKAKMEE